MTSVIGGMSECISNRIKGVYYKSGEFTPTGERDL